MENLPDPIIAGVSVLFAIPLLVAELKVLGMATKYAPLASMIFGVIWMLTARVIVAWPDVLPG